MLYDKIILGGGLYGLYSAFFCGVKGERVLLLECEKEAFARATYVNQARVHMGYHYPRSYSTAIKSANYFNRFVKDFSFCILAEFKKVYATSASFSWTSAGQFKDFCGKAGFPCDEINPEKYFKPNMCDGAFITKEYTYDAKILRDYYLEKLSGLKNVELRYGAVVDDIHAEGDRYLLHTANGESFEAPYLLNATYASTNQVTAMLGFEPFKIKYELCEIILCDVSEPLRDVGITVMDGPFFSIMPFGKTGSHSLTSVTFTPHKTCYTPMPQFECQNDGVGGYCTPSRLGNCNFCVRKPASAQGYMSQMARKYLRDEYAFSYRDSLFSMKPILMASEIDDSRPTVVSVRSRAPTFVSVLSGKINTVYDLDDVLSLPK